MEVSSKRIRPIVYQKRPPRFAVPVESSTKTRRERKGLGTSPFGALRLTPYPHPLRFCRFLEDLKGITGDSRVPPAGRLYNQLACASTPLICPKCEKSAVLWSPNFPAKTPIRAKPDGLTPVVLRAKRPLIAPSRPSSSRLGRLKKSFWRRKVGRGRAHECAPGVSAPSFLQELRLCGPIFPRTVLPQAVSPNGRGWVVVECVGYVALRA